MLLTYTLLGEDITRGLAIHLAGEAKIRDAEYWVMQRNFPSFNVEVKGGWLLRVKRKEAALA